MWKVALLCHGIVHCTGLKMRGEGDEIEIFVDEYFSIAKFSATYTQNVTSITDEYDWEYISAGFKLEPTILTRPP
jgi:hypothetical protein